MLSKARYMYRTIKHVKNKYKIKKYQYILKNDVEEHALGEAIRQNQFLYRKVNLKEPKYFYEKMLWLKYYIYNESPLVAQCYNKYEVRNYIEHKGLKNILNQLYFRCDSIGEINWDYLPPECALKVTNGYAGHVFKRADEKFNKREAIRILKDTWRRSEYIYYFSGDLFAGKTQNRIICEKLLKSNNGFKTPEDYKFYCFNGKPKFINFMCNREDSGVITKQLFTDIELNDRSELEGGCSKGTFRKPECFEEMLEIAEILSEDFPFVRVDLYENEGRPVFGELTFTPSHENTKESEIELGKLLDLSNIDSYRKKLNKRIGV